MKRNNLLQKLILFLVITFTLSNYISSNKTEEDIEEDNNQESNESKGQASKVELLYYSSRENPSIELSQEQQKEFLSDLLDNCPFKSTSYITVGYSGFLYSNSTSECEVKSSYKYEMLLLTLFERLKPEFNDLYKQIKDEIFKNNVSKKLKSNSKCLKKDEKCEISPNAISCCPGSYCTCYRMDCKCKKVEINKATGYDCYNSPVEHDKCPEFSPEKNHNGCFNQNHQFNNCYNYGANYLTNTFAQPGRGSLGKQANKYTCYEVIRASISDGLHYVGFDIPNENPVIGHYVALINNYLNDFHWIRRDCNGYWSHKGGGCPIVNLDNNGKYITDPTLPMGGWKLFCGYFHVIPSKLKMK